MNVLIVDDSREKFREILKCLAECGVSADCVDIAQSVIDAKKSMLGTTYDLLVLDLALPNRPEDEPKPEEGARFLREISERDTYRKPRYIVGLTAFPEVFDEHSREFSELLWVVARYQQESDEWRHRICNLVRHIRSVRKECSDPTMSYDIAVIAALRDPEFQELRKLSCNWREVHSDIDSTDYWAGEFTLLNGDTCTIISATASRMGMVATATLASKMIHQFRPAFICMIGICAGVRGRCELGDVLVADPAWDYQSGKRVGGAVGLKISPHQIPIHDVLQRKFSAFAEEHSCFDEIKRSWQGDQPRTDLRLHLGPVASGSQVLSDAEALSQIEQQHRKLLGIEMEVYGMYAASVESVYLQPVFFSLKGVSDFADDPKTDDMRRYAAFTSARTLESFCKKHLASVRALIRR